MIRKKQIMLAALMSAMVLRISSSASESQDIFLPEEAPTDVVQDIVVENTAQNSVKPEQSEKLVPFSLETHICTYYNEQDQNYLLGAFCEKLKVNESGYDALNEALNAHNAQLEESCKQFVQEYYESAKESRSYYDGSYLFEEYRATVQRADQKILSVTEDYSDFMGGAHGYYATYGMNYDPATGKKLSLKDISQDYDGLYQAVVEKLGAEYPSEAFMDDYRATVRSQFDSAEGPQFYLTTDALHLVFNPYELGSYAAGMFTVSLPYADYPGLVKSDYAYYGDAIIRKLGKNAQIRDDFFKNGQIEDLQVSSTMDMYDYSAGSSSISWNGNTIADNVYGCVDSFYLVQTEDHRIYLYADNTGENEWHSLTVYDLNGSAPTFVGKLDNVGAGGRCLSLPDQMYLESRLYVLGTYSGWKKYHVGPDGMPVADESEYHIATFSDTFNSFLTSTVPIEVKMHAEDGTSYMETLPAGTAYTLIGSDEQTYAVMRLEDGRICDIPLEKSSYQYYINGIIENECFEFLPYAG